MLSLGDVNEYRWIAVEECARRIGAPDLDLMSYIERREAIHAMNPGLLSALDVYYEQLWKCESASPQELAGLIPARDLARENLIAQFAKFPPAMPEPETQDWLDKIQSNLVKNKRP